MREIGVLGVTLEDLRAAVGRYSFSAKAESRRLRLELQRTLVGRLRSSL
jgi:hypothetical protein